MASAASSAEHPGRGEVGAPPDDREDPAAVRLVAAAGDRGASPAWKTRPPPLVGVLEAARSGRRARRGRVVADRRGRCRPSRPAGPAAGPRRCPSRRSPDGARRWRRRGGSGRAGRRAGARRSGSPGSPNRALHSRRTGPLGGEDEAGVQGADERRPTPRPARRGSADGPSGGLRRRGRRRRRAAASRPPSRPCSGRGSPSRSRLWSRAAGRPTRSPPVGQGDDARLGAVEALLRPRPSIGPPEQPGDVRGGLRRVGRPGAVDGHALAGGEPVVLDDEPASTLVERPDRDEAPRPRSGRRSRPPSGRRPRTPTSWQNAFDASIRAASWEGPNVVHRRRGGRRARPSASGRSGPITASSTASARASRTSPSASSTPTGIRRDPGERRDRRAARGDDRPD